MSLPRKKKKSRKRTKKILEAINHSKLKTLDIDRKGMSDHLLVDPIFAEIMLCSFSTTYYDFDVHSAFQGVFRQNILNMYIPNPVSYTHLTLPTTPYV